jgi:hypothetical protein
MVIWLDVMSVDSGICCVFNRTGTCLYKPQTDALPAELRSPQLVFSSLHYLTYLAEDVRILVDCSDSCCSAL